MVLELVTFALLGGTSKERFLDAANDVTRWLANQPGFVSRDLVHDATGDTWIDVVWWRTRAEAEAAASAAMSAEQCAAMFAMIDTERSSMTHGERVATARRSE